MTLPQAKLDQLSARIAGLHFPSTGWQGKARADALQRLTAMGLPGPRDEYWRYTDPKRLNAEGATSPVAQGEVAFDGIDALTLVFRDGVFDAAASSDLAGEGLEISRLADSVTDLHWASEIYGKLEEQGQSPVARPFATLCTAFATDGILIRATGAVARPVAIKYFGETAGSDVILHHVVKVEEGAEVTLLESGDAASRLISVLEVDIAPTGRFHHVRMQGRSHDRLVNTHIFARIASEALFKSFTASLNGTLTRNEAVLDIVGDDAVAHVAGACVGDGDTFHNDDTVFITHAAERCESRQVYKKVLKNGATGVFQGKILVKPGAQKTDGYQISQSLLLDGDSQFLAKPELEIYADDVKCSHGSTSGAIDDTALFYLRSRGVPRRRAETLLVLSFLAEALAEIESENLIADLQARLEDWLDRHEG
ncbi:SufB/SufD family protein [Falsirhodobacter halotolerans]|uniref:SufB/SufD family protein n=1 Tax=Falsirhodobacter halotolerans TaxID=1146892 RepID=UPI001FD335C0|nr:SufD family Fe-S cluster assembly protein [Falsirhodobacter halotolerans]MCJ8139467.1 SufD family Fe-S cluster assembly protein [Falsirhodobacter halotolerans]